MRPRLTKEPYEVRPYSENELVKRGRSTYFNRIRIVEPGKVLKVPEGCIDVWQISAYVGGGWSYHGIGRDFDELLKQAQLLYLNGMRDCRLQIQHKAAIELSPNHFHLIHFHPIKWSNSNEPRTQEEPGSA